MGMVGSDQITTATMFWNALTIDRASANRGKGFPLTAMIPKMSARSSSVVPSSAQLDVINKSHCNPD